MKLDFRTRLLLFYPLAIFLLCGLFVFISSHFFSQSWGRDQVVISALMAFVVMGNFAHNFLSFWQVARLDEFKDWAKEYRFLKLNIWQISAITYLVFLGLLSCLPKTFDTFSGASGTTFWEKFFIFIFLFINTRHALAQTQGIGIGLSHKVVDKEKILSLTIKEKIFYKFLLIDWFLFLGTQLLFKNTWLKDLFLYRNLVLGGFFIWISVAYLRLPREQAWIKFIYNLRHLYRFFFGLHPLLAFLSFGLHGADAVLIYWGSLEKTKSANKRRLKWEFALLFVFFGFVYIATRSFLKLSFESMAIFFTALFLSHYIIEGFMYRMKNPTTRKYISNLL